MRQFLPLTKNKFSSRDRGSVSIFAVAWLGLTALASATIVTATSVVQERAFLQNSADVVALALAHRGEGDAQRLARQLGITIMKTELGDSAVTVIIRNNAGSSRASAHLRAG